MEMFFRFLVCLCLKVGGFILLKPDAHWLLMKKVKTWYQLQSSFILPCAQPRLEELTFSASLIFGLLEVSIGIRFTRNLLGSCFSSFLQRWPQSSQKTLLP